MQKFKTNHPRNQLIHFTLACTLAVILMIGVFYVLPLTYAADLTESNTIDAAGSQPASQVSPQPTPQASPQIVGETMLEKEEVKEFEPSRHWEVSFEYSMPAYGSYTEKNSYNNSVTTNVTGLLYQLSGSVSTYVAKKATDQALELRLNAAVGYLSAMNGVTFALPWSTGLYGAFRNFFVGGDEKDTRLNVFLGGEFQQIPLAQIMIGSTYQSETFSLVWATLGVELDYQLWFRTLRVMPEGGYAPFAPATSSTGTFNHTGWKAGLKASYDLLSGIYIGFDSHYITLTGDTQLNGFLFSGLLGYRF